MLLIVVTYALACALAGAVGLVWLVLDLAQGAMERTDRGNDMRFYREHGFHWRSRYEGDEDRFPWCLGYHRSLKGWFLWGALVLPFAWFFHVVF